MKSKGILRKVLRGLSVTGLVAGLTLTSGCRSDKTSCGQGSCSAQKQEKTSCSGGGAEKSSCSGGAGEKSSCSGGSAEKSSCSG